MISVLTCGETTHFHHSPNTQETLEMNCILSPYITMHISTVCRVKVIIMEKLHWNKTCTLEGLAYSILLHLWNLRTMFQLKSVLRRRRRRRRRHMYANTITWQQYSMTEFCTHMHTAKAAISQLKQEDLYRFTVISYISLNRWYMATARSKHISLCQTSDNRCYVRGNNM